MNFRKIFNILVLLCMFFVFAADYNVYSLESKITAKQLLDMDKSELLSTLKASGLKLPMFYQIYPENAENFVHRMVPLLLNGHDAYIGTFGAEYANQLKKNLGDVLTELGLYPTSSISSLRAIYGLRDSAMLSPWNDKFLEYNCYAYAIGSERFRQPDGSGRESVYNINKNIEDMAKDVLNDLESRGQWGYIMNIKPSSLPDKWFKAICVRKDATYNQDYHFMKMNGSLNSWSHKPGKVNHYNGYINRQMLKFGLAKEFSEISMCQQK